MSRDLDFEAGGKVTNECRHVEVESGPFYTKISAAGLGKMRQFFVCLSVCECANPLLHTLS